MPVQIYGTTSQDINKCMYPTKCMVSEYTHVKSKKTMETGTLVTQGGYQDKTAQSPFSRFGLRRHTVYPPPAY